MQEIWDPTLAPHVWNQYHSQLEDYLRIADSSRMDVLDVGCAQGTLALLLAERGHNVTAVDLRPEFLDYARSRHTHGVIRFVVANVLDDDIPGSFDLIFANQIIEHLVYPQRLLLQLKKCLKPGGRLVVTTPNCDYIINALPNYRSLGNPKNWEHMQFTADSDGHFYAYLSEELIEVFAETGFSDVQASFFDTPAISGQMKIRYLHGRVPAHLLRAIDRLVIKLPWVGRKFSQQLMVTGLMSAVRQC